MRSYLDICRSMNFDSKKSWDAIPKKNKVFHAYKGGVCQTFMTEKEAYAFSELVECSVTNQEDIEKARAEISALENKCQGIWSKELRDEYHHLSDAVFRVCYNRAYDKGHAYGYDEIANVMIGVVEFAEEIIATVKNV